MYLLKDIDLIYIWLSLVRTQIDFSYVLQLHGVWEAFFSNEDDGLK